MSDSEDTTRRQPTPGMRLDIDHDSGDYGMHLDSKMAPLCVDEAQAEANVTYINWLIETDERRRAAQAAEQAKPSDLIVDMGNLSDSRIDRIPLNEDYEAMVEDFIGTFNNAVLQGIRPMTAIYAMSQGFAIVLGFGLRANMPWAAAQEILKQQMESATAASRQVKIITSH